MSVDRPLVLVTGATGFIAGRCVQELLSHGYRVRGTVRDVTRASYLHAIASDLGGTLDLVRADLEQDDGWDAAVAGCDYVLHVASPFPPGVPSDEQELIRPAVAGTRRVLAASADAGTVRRVVLTSSSLAVSAGHRETRPRTEADWADVDHCSPYERSKTLAERAAWEFVAALPAHRRLELAVVNPGMVIGPLLSPRTNTSVETLRKVLDRDVPAVPRIGFVPVDVRDVATAHRLVLEHPAAAGNRYLCAGEHIWLRDMARILAQEFGPQGYRIPTRQMPDWLVKVVARFDPMVRLAATMLGHRHLVSSRKAVTELGWSMRPVRQSLIDTGHSLIAHGLVRERGAAPAPAISSS